MWYYGFLVFFRGYKNLLLEYGENSNLLVNVQIKSKKIEKIAEDADVAGAAAFAGGNILILVSPKFGCTRHSSRKRGSALVGTICRRWNTLWR